MQTFIIRAALLFFLRFICLIGKLKTWRFGVQRYVYVFRYICYYTTIFYERPCSDHTLAPKRCHFPQLVDCRQDSLLEAQTVPERDSDSCTTNETERARSLANDNEESKRTAKFSLHLPSCHAVINGIYQAPLHISYRCCRFLFHLSSLSRSL